MSDEDYEVGYGKPPVDQRFKKGQSGNPRGRPKKSKNLQTLLTRELETEVVVTEAGQKRRITKREALIKRLVNDGLTGKASSQKLLVALLQSGSASDSPETPSFAELDEADKQALEAFERLILEESPVGAEAESGSKPEARKRRRVPRVNPPRLGGDNDSE